MDYSDNLTKRRTFSRIIKPDCMTICSTLAHFSQPNPEEKFLPSQQQQQRNRATTLETSRCSRMSNGTTVPTTDYSNYMKNTYQMIDQNCSTRNFNSKDIRDIIECELKTTLANHKYCPTKSPKLAVTMSEAIKQKVKTRLLSNRYRVVTSVLVTSAKEQGMQVASKGLLANPTDTFASFAWSNSSLHAVVMVFVVYLE